MLEQFYQSCQGELTGWCRKMTQDPVLAEDLVQEAFVRAVEHREVLETLSEPQRKAWIYRTVKNLYFDRIRHMRYEMVSETLPESGEEIWEYDQIGWEQLLNSLPGNEGVLFTLRYLKGYNSREIGAYLDMPAGTVRAQLASARKHLRTALKGERNV